MSSAGDFRLASRVVVLPLVMTASAIGQATRDTTTYRRLKTALDAIPADRHARPPLAVRPSAGPGRNRARQGHEPGRPVAQQLLHRRSPLDRLEARHAVRGLVGQGQERLRDARATSVYRYQLPAFTDLYKVDFDHITDVQARALDDQIFAHYQDQAWLFHVVTERANIELMLNDPYWGRLDFKTDYPFGVLVFNVTTLVSGFSSLRVQVRERRSVPLRAGRGSRSSRSTIISSSSTVCFKRPRGQGRSA